MMVIIWLMMVNNARVMTNIAIVNVSRIRPKCDIHLNGRVFVALLSGVEASPLDEQSPVFGRFGSSPRADQTGGGIRIPKDPSSILVK